MVGCRTTTSMVTQPARLASAVAAAVGRISVVPGGWLPAARGGVTVSMPAATRGGEVHQLISADRGAGFLAGRSGSACLSGVRRRLRGMMARSGLLGRCISAVPRSSQPSVATAPGPELPRMAGSAHQVALCCPAAWLVVGGAMVVCTAIGTGWTRA